MEREMKWANLHIVILMLALVTASLQCSLVCASPGKTGLPPCHRHSQNTGSDCKHSVLVAESRPALKLQSMHAAGAVLLSPQPVKTIFLPRLSAAESRKASPPRGPQLTSSTVLQI